MLVSIAVIKKILNAVILHFLL